MNVHWMVLYNLKVFCSDMKFEMAATAGLSLTLDPMGKMFHNASSMKPLGQQKPTCPGIVIGRSSTKFMFFLCLSKIQDGHHRRTQINIGRMGKYSNAFFSETTNIMSDSPTLYSRWLLLLKIEMSSIVHCCFIINGLKFNCSLCHMDMNSLTYFAGFSLKFFIRPIYVDYANLNLLL